MVEPGHAEKTKASPSNNIYTALVIIGTLFMLAGTVFLAWKSSVIFGTWLPLGQ